jgi:FkbM family methyltransferase
MIINLKPLSEKYNLKINGIIHVGGHYGQEYESYKTLNVPILFFEPLSDNFRVLKNKTQHDPNVLLYQCALGNSNTTINMNVETANQGQSSSILKPKKHLEQYPHITFDHVEEVHMFKLDDLDIDISKYNFINVDVQGYELEVFKGASQSLNHIDYIMSEINRDEVYENCVQIEELDNYLSDHNFLRVETVWEGDIWGDAFYIKNN